MSFVTKRDSTWISASQYFRSEAAQFYPCPSHPSTRPMSHRYASALDLSTITPPLPRHQCVRWSFDADDNRSTRTAHKGVNWKTVANRCWIRERQILFTTKNRSHGPVEAHARDSIQFIVPAQSLLGLPDWEQPVDPLYRSLSPQSSRRALLRQHTEQPRGASARPRSTRITVCSRPSSGGDREPRLSLTNEAYRVQRMRPRAPRV